MGENKRKIWVTCIFLFLGISIYIFSIFRPAVDAVEITENTKDEHEYTSMESVDESKETEIVVTSDSAFPVYLCGQIQNPGIYQIEGPVYLYELIEIAGGLTDQADQDHINMVYVIDAPQSIYVPSVDDDLHEISTGIMQDNYSNEQGLEQESNEHIHININEADLEELCLLPGIGKKTAEKIIDYREQYGLFTSIDQIMNVSGIGDAKYEQICDYIYV